MNWIADLTLLAPEATLFALACIVLLVDILRNDPEHAATYWGTQLSLIVVAALVLLLNPGEMRTAVNGLFVSDPMSTVLKFFICVVSLFAFFYARDYLDKHEMIKGEYYVLGLFAVLGMLVMASAHSLLMVYLALELLSLSLYSMVAMRRDSPAACEAAMKYFVLGALASGMLLYGISIIYGVTGIFGLPEIAAHIARAGETDLLLVFGLVFLIVGIAFKLGAVPFHMWIPDVYEGAPTSVTLFIASAPKLAAFAMAMRLLVDGMAPLLADWQDMLIILSVLSMAIGNVIAIAQSNIKRMLAYSTIAHVGFLLLGILSGNSGGFAGAMFYVITYALMSMGAFGMVILLGSRGFEADRLEDFKGLADCSPWFAFLMLILMFSLAGVPPFLGFWAKWFVLREVIAADLIWLAAVAVVFAIIGAYYYLRIVKLMFFDPAEDTTAPAPSRPLALVISINSIALLVLGMSPGVLMAVCTAALAP